jgi:hypothetical protein
MGHVLCAEWWIRLNLFKDCIGSARRFWIMASCSVREWIGLHQSRTHALAWRCAKASVSSRMWRDSNKSLKGGWPERIWTGDEFTFSGAFGRGANRKIPRIVLTLDYFVEEKCSETTSTSRKQLHSAGHTKLHSLFPGETLISGFGRLSSIRMLKLRYSL